MRDPHELETQERLTRLWRDAEPTVSAYVFAAIRSPQDAEDVVQQVALAAVRRFEEYDSTRPFVAWALWLAKSRITDHYRKQGRERLVFSDCLLDQLAEALVQRQPERAARHDALERCIEKLPEKSRQLLQRRYEDGSSMESVAEALRSSAASVRVLLFRIRNLLAECIKTELSKQNP